ncbi:MAG TPA: hypothetical protein VJQ56_08975 [Blastocatellia bacterium]|nr:hypothetical protein [Blastocatellia bacterium]
MVVAVNQKPVEDGRAARTAGGSTPLEYAARARGRVWNLWWFEAGLDRKPSPHLEPESLSQIKVQVL